MPRSIYGRHEHYQRALREPNPGLRDAHLAAAEAALIGVLTSQRNNRYGDATQDPRAVYLVSGQTIEYADKRLDETFWTDGLQLESDCLTQEHGWSTDVDPFAGA